MIIIERQRNNCSYLVTYKFELGPLTVQEEGGHEEWKESKQRSRSSQQPEVVLEVHQDQEQVDHHGSEWKKNTVHFARL